MTRTFESKPAVRENVPIWVGLFGSSGSGKTFSALRLATGFGGEIYVIDTEACRALHYADSFRFRHVDFAAPFSSTDYLAAVRSCVAAGSRSTAAATGDPSGASYPPQANGLAAGRPRATIIIDSASHEHEGEGGYLKTQEAEVTRLAGGDEAKRERVKLLSWAKPAGMRQAMINGLLQINTNVIFCFRAKEKTKPVKDNGKMVMHDLGWMPIAGPNLLYEMTVNCLLLPNAGGVPSWQSEFDGERSMMKLPQQFREMFAKREPLSEEIGAKLAAWARGDVADKPAASTPFGNEDKTLYAAARDGTAELMKAWKSIPRDAQAYLKPRLDSTYKPLADEVDMRAGA